MHCREIISFVPSCIMSMVGVEVNIEYLQINFNLSTTALKPVNLLKSNPN